MKDFLLKPEFFSEILLEAKALSELNAPKKELERKNKKIYEINMQLDALSELSLIGLTTAKNLKKPKGVTNYFGPKDIRK